MATGGEEALWGVSHSPTCITTLYHGMDMGSH